MATLKQIGATLGTILVWIYGIGVALHTIIFEWQYAVEHGPLAWFLFGWIVGAFKALAWPLYYIF